MTCDNFEIVSDFNDIPEVLLAIVQGAGRPEMYETPHCELESKPQSKRRNHDNN